jgi:hypothetical protein
MGPTKPAPTKDYFNHNGNPPANDQYPAGATPASTDRSSKLYRLNATENKTGLEFMLKLWRGIRWIFLVTPTTSIPPK